ncbi:MAG: methyltransferase domain-containing protein [Chloroflexi bacterium]|nr:methyltransferase domain-containing protein [Chloroflexota bacterium]
MSGRTFLRVSLWSTFLVGFVVTAYWLARGDAMTAVLSAPASALKIAPIVALSTLSSLGVRFVRWHYLLRANGLLVPLRDSLGIYLAGFAMVWTPAHAGEVVKALLLRWRYALPLTTTVPIVAGERVYDVMAILLIVAASSGWVRSPWLALTLVVVCLLGLAVLGRAAGAGAGRLLAEGGWFASLRRHQPAVVAAAGVVARLTGPGTASVCLALSALSWAIAASGLALGLAVTGSPVAPQDAVFAFASGTALGAFSLLPAGVGIGGSVMILNLAGAGLPLDIATTSVLITRAGTVWLATGIGFLALGSITHRLVWPDRYLEADHFELLAPHYAEEIPQHVRDHLLRKKTDPMLLRMERTGPSCVVVDLGCGQGWYAAEMARRTGGRVLGIDLAEGQLRRAMAEGDGPPTHTAFAVGTILMLPLASGSVDFVYSINAFHHLGTVEAQRQALAEVTRMLKPGGLFFLQEMNVANPVLRAYLGYLFPLLRSIDVGTERWVHPGTLPDFLPQPLLGLARSVEARLEGSGLRRWSSHYMAVYRRVPASE